MLIQAGADVNASDNASKTALVTITDTNTREIVLKSVTRYNVLSYIWRTNNLKILILLIAAGRRSNTVQWRIQDFP